MHTDRTRRHALRALGALPLLGLTGRPARAADFPMRPITLLCPFGAGGSVDQYMRALSPLLAKQLGQQVIIENKPGAGGALASAMAARARPDGYTLAMTSGSTFRAPWLQPQIGFSPLEDFSYIAGMTSLEFCAVVRADSPLRSFADFMAHARAHPGTQYAAGDPTTLGPVTLKASEEKFGVQLEHIPFNSGSEMATALLGGHVGIVIDSVGTYVPHIRAGKLRLLAALGEVRFKAWPGIQTAREQGYDLVLSSPMGLIGPRGIPAPVVRRLHDALRQAMRAPEIAAVLDVLNQPEWYRDPAGFEAYARQVYAESGELLRKAGVIQS